jgi:hypothetical protein
LFAVVLLLGSQAPPCFDRFNDLMQDLMNPIVNSCKLGKPKNVPDIAMVPLLKMGKTMVTISNWGFNAITLNGL